MSGETNGRTDHLARLLVGLGWAFMALMMSAIYEELGYGWLESGIFGVVSVPVSLVALYALGTVGLWIINVTGIRRMIA